MQQVYLNENTFSLFLYITCIIFMFPFIMFIQKQLIVKRFFFTTEFVLCFVKVNKDFLKIIFMLIDIVKFFLNCQVHMHLSRIFGDWYAINCLFSTLKLQMISRITD